MATNSLYVGAIQPGGRYVGAIQPAASAPAAARPPRPVVVAQEPPTPYPGGVRVCFSNPTQTATAVPARPAVAMSETIPPQTEE